MAKATKLTAQIMSPDHERYMAFESLVQWTQAVVMQSARTSAAQARSTAAAMTGSSANCRLSHFALQSECHFFVISAYKFMEFRKWCLALGLCSSIDFSTMNGFSDQDLKDLRDMREHVVDYFQGIGRVPTRWVKADPDGSTDASAITDTKIGGRLDWVAFGAAAQTVLAQLLKEPSPSLPM